MGEMFPAGEQNDEIDRIRQCADTVAQAVIERFLDENGPTIH
jgi:hypothetical protein